MKKYLIGLLMICLSACSSENQNFQASVLSELGSTVSVNVEKFENYIAAANIGQNLELLDVRTKQEYNAGCLKNSKNIDFYFNDFNSKLDQLDKSKTYLIYCRSGNRSGKTVDIMREKGFKAVYDLKGGIINWQNSGREIEQNCV